MQHHWYWFSLQIYFFPKSSCTYSLLSSSLHTAVPAVIINAACRSHANALNRNLKLTPSVSAVQYHAMETIVIPDQQEPRWHVGVHRITLAAALVAQNMLKSERNFIGVSADTPMIQKSVKNTKETWRNMETTRDGFADSQRNRWYITISSN